MSIAEILAYIAFGEVILFCLLTTIVRIGLDDFDWGQVRAGIIFVHVWGVLSIAAIFGVFDGIAAIHHAFH